MDGQACTPVDTPFIQIARIGTLSRCKQRIPLDMLDMLDTAINSANAHAA